MRGIIKNDFLILKSNIKSFAFLFLMFYAVSFFTEHILLFGNAVIYMISTSIFLTQYLNDLSSGWLVYCNAAPVSRKDYVKSRYISMVMFSFIMLGIFMVLSPLNPHLVKHGLFNYFVENIILLTIAFATAAIFLPVIFKAKETTAKITVSFATGTITGLSTLFSIDLQFVEPHIVIVILCFVISLPLLYFSFKLSCKIYEKKDI